MVDSFYEAAIADANNGSTETETEVTNSVSDGNEVKEDASATTPVEEVGQDEGVPTTEPEAKETEPKQDGEEKGEEVNNANEEPKRKEYHRSEDPLARARYTASKYKQKYNSLQRSYESRIARMEQALKEKVAQLRHYQELDPEKIEDAAQKQAYLAWRESTTQRARDLEEDINNLSNERNAELNSISRAANDELYNAKVDYCYGENDSRFRELEQEQGEGYEAACDMYDKQGVIRDFMKRSKYSPAIKHILYERPDLQEELFVNVSSNPYTAASQRLDLLKDIERSVDNYMTNRNAPKAQPAVVPTAPKASPVTAKRALKHLETKVQSAPKSNIEFKGTGSLIKGNETNGNADTSAEADKLAMRYLGL